MNYDNNNIKKLRESFISERILLWSGTLSSLYYFVINIFVPFKYEGYDVVTQTVSELSAIGSPTKTLWELLCIPYLILIIAFGLGILKIAGQNKNLKLVGKFILLNGIVSLGWRYAPMHMREVIAAGGGNYSDTMHIALSMVTVLLMLLALGFGAFAFGKYFRIYSIVTILLLLIFGIMTAIEAPAINTGQPTPMIGIWERINIGVYFIWLIVLSAETLRKLPKTEMTGSTISIQ